ncbi:MAG: FRG domain-containing protein [Desulfomicrobium sp.]|nr:FRG domain-containing protein [Desulfomicrobium sp.]
MTINKASLGEISDVAEFLQSIFSLGTTTGTRCYRGEANSTWELKPSIMRGLRKDAEKNIIRELTLEVPDDFSNDRSMFSRLVRAQHYGLPTRLLDVSFNPLVALFFACYDESESSNSADVIVMSFKNTRVKFADSDAVSIISNLANLDDDEKEAIDQFISDHVKRGIIYSEMRKAINELIQTDRLVHFVRAEKPYFRLNVDQHDFRKYYLVHPHKSNKRVIAQSGAFVLSGFMRYLNPDRNHSFSADRIRVPAQHKEKILRQLDQLNINHRAMFPEIETASKYIKRKWTKSSTDLNELLFGDVFG